MTFKVEDLKLKKEDIGLYTNVALAGAVGYLTYMFLHALWKDHLPPPPEPAHFKEAEYSPEAPKSKEFKEAWTQGDIDNAIATGFLKDGMTIEDALRAWARAGKPKAPLPPEQEPEWGAL